MPRKARGQEDDDPGGRARLLKGGDAPVCHQGLRGRERPRHSAGRRGDGTRPLLPLRQQRRPLPALAREGAEKIDAARSKALDEAGTTVERIRRFCLAIVSVRREFAELAWVVEAILTGPPEAAPRFDFRGEFNKMFHQLQDLVQEGVDHGELRPCNPHTRRARAPRFHGVASRPRMAEIVRAHCRRRDRGNAVSDLAARSTMCMRLRLQPFSRQASVVQGLASQAPPAGQHVAWSYHGPVSQAPRGLTRARHLFTITLVTYTPGHSGIGWA